MTDEEHRRTVEVEAVIDSDNEESRCGCPAGDEETWWTARINGSGQPGPLVAECSICGATWQWGEVCAAPLTAREVAGRLSDFFMANGNFTAVRR